MKGHSISRVSATRSSWRDILVIFIAAAFGPAMVLLNQSEPRSLLTALVVVLAVFGLALSFQRFLTARGAAPKGAATSIAIFLFAFLNLGSLVPNVLGGRWALLLASLLASSIAYSLRDLRGVDVFVVWGAFALAIGAALTWASTLDFSTPDRVYHGTPVPSPAVESTQDVVVIVADGYASNAVLADLYGYDNTGFTFELESMGLVVNPDMRSNYGKTMFSIPSFLSLAYVRSDIPITPRFRSALFAALGGENWTAETLRANGYRTVYVESGWLGTRCSTSIDVCVHDPWPDKTLYDIAHRSLLRDSPGFEEGRTFSRGAVHAMSWLDADLDHYLSDDQADFIYVHLMAPHAPMFLDRSCGLDIRSEVAGYSIGAPWLQESQMRVRIDGYLQQVECVNSHLKSVASKAVTADAVLLMLADHGPDRAGQLYISADTWSKKEKQERFGVLFAAYHPGCDYSSVSTLVNAGRRLMTCMSGVEFPKLADRYFGQQGPSAGDGLIELASPS